MIDQDYYPEVELFDDFQAARERFAEIAAEHEGREAPESTIGHVRGPAQIYLGVHLRSHTLGHRLVTVEDW